MTLAIGKGQPVHTTKIRSTLVAPVNRSEREFELPAAAPVQPTKRARATRPLKLAIATALVGLGVYALVADQGSVVSNNAVVSAYVTALRAPIDGIVSTLMLDAGSPVSAGDPAAQLDNPRVDDGPLIELRSNLMRISADRAAAETLRDRLLALRQQLAVRTQQFTVATSARLDAEAAEAKQALAALVVQRDQSERDLHRRAQLVEPGFVAWAEVERLRSGLAAAEDNVGVQAERLGASRIKAEAARNGVLTEPGSNDVTYSMQRLDEVDMRLAELGRSLTTSAADVEALTGRLQAAERRDSLNRRAILTAPSAGMVWKRMAANGERLGAGDVAIELVDCRQIFLLAALPQDRFSDVEVGATAHFRLSGERTEREGRVQSVSGEANLAGDRNLAAAPIGQPGSTATARVAISPSANAAGECLVGRTARVLLPTSGGGLLTRLVRRLF